MSKKMLFLVVLAVMLAATMRAAVGHSDPLGLADGSRVLFVDLNNTNCSDANSRATALDPNSPWCRPQAAFNSVQSGDTIYIGNGTYNADLNFTNNIFTSNVIISSYPGKTANIISEYRNFSNLALANWQNGSDGTHTMFWSTVAGSGYVAYGDTFAYFDNGTALFSYQQYDSDNNWEDFLNLSKPKGIYTNDTADLIWISSADPSFNPNLTILHIGNFSASSAGVIGISNKRGDGKLIFRNLNVSYGKRLFRIYNSTNIVIDNCSLMGAGGIYIANWTTQNVSIINNHIFTDRPAYWAWNDLKGTTWETNAVVAHYGSAWGDNVDIINNTIHGFFNGVGGSFEAYTPTGAVTGKNNRVMHNTFYNILDDAIEWESYASNLTVYNNTMHDVFVGLAMAYSKSNYSASRALYNAIVSNLTIKWYATDAAPATNGYCFKIGESGSATTNWTFAHNTCYSQGKGFSGVDQNSLNHTNFTDTIFSTWSSTANYPVQRGGYEQNIVLYDYNIYWNNLSTDIFQYYNNDTAATEYSLASSRSNGTYTAVSWDAHSQQINPNFTTGLYSIMPSVNSPVIDAASSAFGYSVDVFGNPIYGTADIGAIEYQPPHNISRDTLCAVSSVRVYGDGKFRNKTACTGSAVDLHLVPTTGWTSYGASDTRPQIVDVNVSTFTQSDVVFGQDFAVLSNINYQLDGMYNSKWYDIYLDSTLEDTIKSNSTGGLGFSLTGLSGYTTVTVRYTTTPNTPISSVMEDFSAGILVFVGFFGIIVMLLSIGVLLAIWHKGVINSQELAAGIFAIVLTAILIGVGVVIFGALGAVP